MSDRGEDALATHVVASSALNLLRELIEAGGENYVEQVLKLGLFSAASARLKGDPITLPTNPQINALNETVAGGLKAHRASVGKGQSVSGRVNLGEPRILKKT